MKRVVIASTNPVKTEAVRAAFSKLFPDETFEYEGLSAQSGVSEQPMSDEETLLGATNRAAHVAKAQPDADFWVGIEGGCQTVNTEMSAFAWVVVRSKGSIGKGRTGEFFLPPRLRELVEAGKSLGEADDIVFARADSGQKNGSVGLLTKDTVTRTRFHEDAVLLALIPFVHQDLYN